eukprot:TRINITY_DN68010_c9_g1_i2.p1 TRINITY_DN68010_c9_g1~~TRINITY_DN68010_c9_g1_i2.p1  ORF type:complete len:363 (+),score=47.02 TRINITY_DN68010_c9_g1_i2:70-1158(+)
MTLTRNQAMRLLGISSVPTTKAQWDKMRRDVFRQYHPDMVVNQGSEPMTPQQAHEQFLRMREAVDILEVGQNHHQNHHPHQNHHHSRRGFKPQQQPEDFTDLRQQQTAAWSTVFAEAKKAKQEFAALKDQLNMEAKHFRRWFHPRCWNPHECRQLLKLVREWKQQESSLSPHESAILQSKTGHYAVYWQDDTAAAVDQSNSGSTLYVSSRTTLKDLLFFEVVVPPLLQGEAAVQAKATRRRLQKTKATMKRMLGGVSVIVPSWLDSDETTSCKVADGMEELCKGFLPKLQTAWQPIVNKKFVTLSFSPSYMPTNACSIHNEFITVDFRCSQKTVHEFLELLCDPTTVASLNKLPIFTNEWQS